MSKRDSRRSHSMRNFKIKEIKQIRAISRSLTSTEKLKLTLKSGMNKAKE